MPIITISRQMGSLGDEIAALLAQRFNMELIVREKAIKEWLSKIASDYELHMLIESPKFYDTLSKEGITFKKLIEKQLIETAGNASCIIMGMGSQIIFANHPSAVNIRIIAPLEARIERIQKQFGIPASDAEAILLRADKKHKRYIGTLYNKDWDDPLLYDLTINTNTIGIEEAAELIEFFSKERHLYCSIDSKPNKFADVTKKDKANLTFKHPAELEFARILDMYNIEWEYEPKTFPVEWDAEGNVTMAFSPDFYLTKFDTYIEITTMEQKYVTTKNKKVRKLRELYPGINIRIVYKKDFHTLLKRFSAFKGDHEV